MAAALGGAAPLPGQQQPAAQPAAKPAARPAAYGATSAAGTAATMLPMTTASDAAREHATLGQRSLDFGHQPEAAAHFREALAADSTFAFGWLGAANSSTSVADVARDLRTASRLAPKASRAERLQIAIAERQLSGDQEGAATLARQLVQAAPRNPRAYLTLATVQTALNREGDARRSMERAVAVAPGFAPAYVQLAYSYLLAAPRAPAKAEAPIRKAIALEPKESSPYIALGSFGRAMNRLDDARVAYTRAAEVDPSTALPLQQRGHVNTFLGDYDAARADYDAAIRLGKDDEPAAYAVYRAFVPAYAGDPRGSIAELDAVARKIDGMSIPDRDGQKVFALTSLAQIATHVGDVDAARRALDQRAALLRKQAAAVGSDEYKRTQEADIAYREGLLAARRKDYAAATAKAKEAMHDVAANGDPTRDQQAHALLGYVALDQKRYGDAVAHFSQANPNDMYVAYHRAQALVGAGRTADAKKLFREVATYNFSVPDVALVRAEARKRAK
jgi:tetratricopeptide (TPR) repeat protein